MEKLGKRITKEITFYIINKAENSDDALAITANDIEYIEDRTYSAKTSTFNFQWIWVILFVFILVGGLMYKGDYKFIVISLFSLFPILGFLYHYIAPTKHFIANRQTGMLHMPISKKKPQKIIAFNDGDGIIKTYYLDNFYTSLFFQTKKGVEPKAAMGLADWEREDYWSFLVWYMDKNRPLPPGKAFDPYREKDFQRRKAEGFPKPLYPSDVPTPEATPEQQAERKRIGGW